MSRERGDLLIPSDTRASQALASDPARSIWVEANAGSGKTFVLTQRVLRLLLAGVEPQSILCLTYTKAAAAEMRKRVSDRLAQWAVADTAALRAALAELTGAPPGEAMLQTARTLFARALETPGGLRILTIHAFCEAVLHRFPIEAGVPFDFSVIEDDQRAGMVLAAREAVIAEGLRGGANGASVETLFGLMSDHAIAEAIDAALAEGARLRPVLADVPAAGARLRRLVGASGEATALEARFAAGTLLTPQVLRDLLARCGGDPQGNRRCLDLLARLDPDRPDPAALRSAFFTGTGPRASLMTRTEQAAHPDIFAILEAEQRRLVALEAELAAARLVERSEALLEVVAAIVRRYEDDKRRHSLLDFDDLIERLGDLLADRGLGPWVQYKLDAGIDHILVDESQDTNERQWRVVRAMAEEFFVGDGAVRRPRSLFAVGDQKQSIYSFQGAQPILFGQTGRDFARRAGDAALDFRRLPLHTSFRTLPGILEAVDRVCDRPDIQAALLSEDKVVHAPARRQPGGMVTLWPPVQAERPVREGRSWPLEPVEAEQSAPRRVALRIVREISGWLAAARPLAQRGRPVTADDVLILVQSRNALFQEIIRALRAEGLPTPGADRLGVTGHIAVLDLLALIDVVLNPADDLQLAALLRSPLFDIGEDDLFAIAAGRPPGQTLWSALFASTLPGAIEAAARLGRWRATLDFERPYEFLAQVLYAEGGLRRFHARLGMEVDDVLSELLQLALDHEQTRQPSLQGFAAEMRRRAVAIKRELAESGGGVRVMTVHGAKGLEAPIVILADAASKPSVRQTGKPVYVLPDGEGPLLIHASSARQHVPATAAIKERIDANQAQEYWRKLYVAMTRAEDELYVTGPLTAGQKAETQLKGSWYEAIDMALRPHARVETGPDGAELALVFPARQPPPLPARPAAGAPPPVAGPLVAPPVPAPADIPVLSPSRAGEAGIAGFGLESLAERVRDAELARRSGLALHALLQHLGKVERARWPAVLPRALETLLPEFPDRHAALAARALSIVSRPELAFLFGPHSRAEVPFLVSALRRGEPVSLSGRIDRVVVDDSGVLVIDYKSDATVPGRVADVPGNYRTQLGLYALVAGQLFPGRPVRAAILWTELESLMNLPHELLAEARADFTLR